MERHEREKEQADHAKMIKYVVKYKRKTKCAVIINYYLL